MKSSETTRDSHRVVRTILLVFVIATLLYAVSAWVTSYLGLSALFESLSGVGPVALIMLAYTMIPMVQDRPDPLIVWPAVMLILAAIALVDLGAAVFQGPFGAAWGPILGPLTLLIIVVFMLAGVVMLIVGAVATLGTVPEDFVSPILLRAMKDTHPSHDRPYPIEVADSTGALLRAAPLIATVGSGRDADSVRRQHGQIVIRIARVHGLPRFWTLLLRPFGETILRVSPSGVARVTVDAHVYRLLDRPGPYPLYCRNVVEALGSVPAQSASGEPVRSL